MYVTSRQRHNQAMLAPSRREEKAVVQLLRGLKEYHELLQADDCRMPHAVVIQGMSDIARGLHKLIQQGPIGRLDKDLVCAEIAAFVGEPPAAGMLSLVHDETGTERPADASRVLAHA